MKYPIEYGVMDPVTKKELRMVLQTDYAEIEAKLRFYREWLEHLILEQRLCRWDDCDWCRNEIEVEALK